MPSNTFDLYMEEHPDAHECGHLMVRGDLSNLWDILREYGVAVIPHTLNDAECDDALQHIHSFYMNLTQRMKVPYNHEDPTTYRTLSELHKMHGMLFQSYGVGQNQASWNIRQHPNVYQAFCALWGDDDLLTSMDGLSYQIAPELVPTAKGKDNTRAGFFQYTWFHTDQSYTRNELECIQGQVNLFDVDPGDATLVVLEKSHNFHGEFATTFGEGSKADWFALEMRGKERGEGYKAFYLDRGCQERRITCPRGSLILWDSRTIHCGSEPLRGRPSRHWRSVVYVCMTPRYLCDRATMEKRRQAFIEQCTTSHWPHRINIFKTLATGMFVTHPPDINLSKPYPVLTGLGKQLLLGKDGVDTFPELSTESAATLDYPEVDANGRPKKKAKTAGKK